MFYLFHLFRSFVRSLARSKIFQILVRVGAIDLVQKSSNFEPSSRFFGCLKIFDFLVLWFIIKDMDPWIHGSAAGAAASAATVCTYYVIVGGRSICT